jgi:hypothetical protein
VQEGHFLIPNTGREGFYEALLLASVRPAEPDHRRAGH